MWGKNDKEPTRSGDSNCDIFEENEHNIMVNQTIWVNTNKEI